MNDVLIRTNTYIVDEPSTLVVFLLKSCSFLYTASDILNLCSQKRLLVNGELVMSNVEVDSLDTVELLTPQSYEPPVCEDIELVYEDEYFFAVFKPAQLPVHPTGKYYFNTLSSLVQRNLHLDAQFPYNRLDRETSGIVLFAKKSEYVVLLQEVLIDKWYYALVFGRLKASEVIEEPLLKKTVGELRHHMVVDSEGKKATTKYAVVSSNHKYSLVKVKLITGRKHQIRAHMAYIGHPIVGDKQYGAQSDFFISFIKNPRAYSADDITGAVGASRQLLHCFKVEFVHPKTSNLVSIEVNIGKYFSDFLFEQKIDLR